MGGNQSVPEPALPRPARPRPPAYWRVSMEARGRGGFLKVTGAGPRLVSPGGPAPCVFLSPENGSAEDYEATDSMPRFRISSASGVWLTGPQREASGARSAEGARAEASAREDAGDFLEAYPAPTGDAPDAQTLNVYLWSPSRACALSAAADGSLWWRPAAASAVLNYGTSPSATVWAVRWRGEPSA